MLETINVQKQQDKQEKKNQINLNISGIFINYLLLLKYN